MKNKKLIIAGLVACSFVLVGVIAVLNRKPVDTVQLEDTTKVAEIETTLNLHNSDIESKESVTESVAVETTVQPETSTEPETTKLEIKVIETTTSEAIPESESETEIVTTTITATTSDTTPVITELTEIEEKPTIPIPETTSHSEEETTHEIPSDPALTNPEVKPDEIPVPTTTAQPVDSNPSSGETNANGEIYIPGFGWIPNEGGGGEGRSSGSDGDWDKMIGY